MPRAADGGSSRYAPMRAAPPPSRADCKQPRRSPLAARRSPLAARRSPLAARRGGHRDCCFLDAGLLVRLSQVVRL